MSHTDNQIDNQKTSISIDKLELSKDSEKHIKIPKSTTNPKETIESINKEELTSIPVSPSEQNTFPVTNESLKVPRKVPIDTESLNEQSDPPVVVEPLKQLPIPRNPFVYSKRSNSINALSAEKCFIQPHHIVFASEDVDSGPAQHYPILFGLKIIAENSPRTYISDAEKIFKKTVGQAAEKTAKKVITGISNTKKLIISNVLEAIENCIDEAVIARTIRISLESRIKNRRAFILAIKRAIKESEFTGKDVTLTIKDSVVSAIENSIKMFNIEVL